MQKEHFGLCPVWQEEREPEIVLRLPGNSESLLLVTSPLRVTTFRRPQLKCTTSVFLVTERSVFSGRQEGHAHTNAPVIKGPRQPQKQRFSGSPLRC